MGERPGLSQGVVVVLGGLGLAAAVSCGPSWQSKALVQLNIAREQENADYALLRVYPSCDGAPEDARCGPVMPYLMTAEARSGFRERVCGPKGLDAKSCEDLWLRRVQRELEILPCRLGDSADGMSGARREVRHARSPRSHPLHSFP